MAKSIDQRIVEMNFENDKFEKNVGQSLKTIENLEKSLDFKGGTKGLEGITAAANRVDFSGMERGIETIKDRFSIMGAVAFTIIQEITRKVIDMASNIARALVITPITTGFEEYELKLGSIQTIMAGTGESLETVNSYLNELNEYADKTIYSFSDMTQNIGKFTNAGVGLGEAVNAIKGVANVAAVSGANSNEASRAMYNFAQALSAGYVKLIDWKSIELANMGTVEFKQQLIDSAEAAGTLTKEADGMYKTLEGKTLSATMGFNEALTDQWLTSQVLITTLNRYSDVNTEIGKKATAAAQDVKTFTMLIDTLKEALQSGWAYTWELLLGDFDEAKELFTTLSDIFGGMVGRAADSRNALLSAWKELGGREDLVQGTYNLLYGFQNLIGIIKDAFREFFPPLTAERLKSFTSAFLNLTEKFKMAVDRSEGIRTVFRGLFALLDIGRMIITDVVKSLFGFSETMSPVTDGLKGVILRVSEFIINLREGMKSSGGFFNSLKPIMDKLAPYTEKLKEFYERLKDVVSLLKEKVSGFKLPDFSGVKDFLANFVGGLSINLKPLTLLWEIFGKTLGIIWKLITKFIPIFAKFATSAGEGISSFLSNVYDKLENIDVTTIFTAINTGLFGGILLAIKRFIDTGGDVFGGVANILDGVGDSLRAWQSNLKAKTLLTIAGAIAVLAISIAIIGSVDSAKVTSSLGAMTVLILQLFAAMKAFSTVSSGIGSVATMTFGLLGISTALLLISVAVANLSRIDPEALTQGTLALTAIIFLLRGAATELSKSSAKAIAGATALGILSIALNIVVLAVFALGSIDPGKLTQGLLALTAILAELVIFVNLISGTKGLIAASAGIYILSAALVLLTGSIFLLGTMPVEKLQQGLIGMGAALLIIATGMRLIPKNILVTAAGLIIVANALLILSGALRILGGMTWEQLAIGLIALGGSMIIIAAGLYAMSGAIGGAAALAIASGALVLLAGALKVLGSLSLKEIGIALLAIVGVLVVLGVATLLLTPLIPALLGLAGALLLFGVAAALVGVGILALSIGLGTLATVGAAGIGVLVLALSSIIGLLPFVATQVGKALLILIQTLAAGAPLLLKTLVEILLLLIEGIVQIIPPAVDAILLLATTLLQKLAEKTPDIVQAGIDMLLGLLEGIRDNIGEVVSTAIEIVEEFLKTIGEKIPDLVDAGFDMLISIVDGIADSVSTQVPRLIESVKKLGKAIIDGIVKGITGSDFSVTNAISNLGKNALSAFKSILGIDSPSKEFFEQAKYIITGLVSGISTFARNAYDSVTEFGGGLVNKFNEVTEKISEAIDSDMQIQPVIAPVVDLSEFDKGASKVQKFFDSSNLGIGVSVKQASLVASGFANLSGSNAGQVATDGQPIQYIQNNYSPKELSRYEIYRQTRNQLIQAKGDIPV